jgi:type II secretory pathway pseudopilin PulG
MKQAFRLAGAPVIVFWALLGSLSAQNPVLRTNSGAQKFFGTAPPTNVTGNLPGDLFTDTTNHNEYVCNAPSGTSAPACTSVTTTGWLLLNGGGGPVAGLLLSGAGDPSIPLVSVVQYKHLGTCGRPCFLAFNSNVTVGSLLIVVLGGNSNIPNPPTITDTLKNSWTQAFYRSQGGSVPNEVSVSVAIANASGATTISVTTGSGLIIAEIAGNVSQSVDAAATSSATPVSFPSVVTSQPSDLLLSAGDFDAAGPGTVTAPEVIIDSVDSASVALTLSWVIVPNIGSVASSLFHASVSNVAYGSVAFKTQPPTSPGNNGDWFLNLTSGKLWGPKTAGIWGPSGFTFTP